MKRFFECLIPITACNLKCGYCYVIQEGRRKLEMPKFKYSPEHIGKALSVERLGGISYISITGSGETMMVKELPEIVKHILSQGHFVNITNNGTITKKLKELINITPTNDLKRLHFAFSFHYNELVRTKKLEVFFDNVLLVKEAGCSFLVQINLTDEYLPHLKEIKNIVKSKVGAYPQVAATRDESQKEYKLLTGLSNDEYVFVGQSFESPLFNFTMKNFMVKRKEFCYAGDWSAKLDLSTGDMTGCYGFGIKQNIYNDLTEKIKFEAIGCNCPFQFCFNSSHFMSLGNIPSIETPTYGELRNRTKVNWYTKEMEKFLSGKLSDDNRQYSYSKSIRINVKYFIGNIFVKISYKVKRILKC